MRNGAALIGEKIQYFLRKDDPAVFYFDILALFDTTSRALGGRTELCWRTLRASHPSEDLSELPPLRDPASQGCGWAGVPL